MSLGLLKIARGEPVAFDDVFTGGRFVCDDDSRGSHHRRCIVMVPIVRRWASSWRRLSRSCSARSP